MSNPSEPDPALDKAKDAYEDELGTADDRPLAEPPPASPVPNPEEDELTGIAPA